MNGSLAPFRRRFLLRSCLLIASAVAACFAVVWVAQLGQHGLVLAAFFAALMLVLGVRALSEVWSATGLELVEELRMPLNFPGHKITSGGDLEKDFEEVRDHLSATTQKARQMSEQRRQLLGEVFHALSQPLTSLRCSLELGMRTRRSAEEYRVRLAEALEQAECTVRLTAQLRHLAEAIDCDDCGQTCRFEAALKTAADEIAALGEVRNVGVRIASGPSVTVPCNVQRLAQALCHVFEFALDCAPPESILAAHSEISREGLVLTIESEIASAPESDPSLDETSSRATLGVRIADHILQTTGGKLERQLMAGHQVLRATLPMIGVVRGRTSVEPVLAEISSPPRAIS